MTTIDSGIGPDLPTGPATPAVALRLVTTYDDRTRRIDIALDGARSIAVEGGVATTFPTERLWPVVRDLLPPLEQLRAAPHGRPATDPRRPGPTFVEDCRAFVAIATVVDTDPDPDTDAPEGEVGVRSWLATDDDLWSVTPLADGSTEVAPAPEGALADLLVWDVTAAFETLVRRLGDAS